MLCCGGDSLWCLRELLPELRVHVPERIRIGEEEGRIHGVVASWGEVAVIAVRHLTGARPTPSRDNLVLVGERLREALA